MPIPISFAQVNYLFAGSGLPRGAQITMGYDISGSAGTPAAVGASLNSAWSASGIQARLATGVDYKGCLVKFGPDATGPSALVSASVTGSGGPGASSQVSWLVRKITGSGGRAGRGRWYIPGVPEGAIGSDGAIDGTARTNLEGELDELLVSWAAAGIDPVVLHGVGSPLSTPTPITDLVVDTRGATQRRRLRG